MNKARRFRHAAFLALLLAVVLAACLLAPAAAAGGQVSVAGNSWEAIRQIEAAAEAQFRPTDLAGRTAAFTQNVEQMIRAVQAAPDYVPGSLDRHGEFFFWQTTDGRVNGYSPCLRSQLKDSAAQTPRAVSLPAPEEAPLQSSGSTPENRNVSVFISYSNSYYFEYEKGIADGQRLAHSTSGSLCVYLQENANVDNLAKAVSEAGVLIVHSHGITDYQLGKDYATHANTSYICLPSGEGITAYDQRTVTGQFGTYHHAFYAGTNELGEEYYCVDGACIVDHMPGRAPNSFVLLGCCLGMATEGLFGPLRANGVEAALGYSLAVTTNADLAYREVLCGELENGRTLGQAVASMKEAVGCPDPYQPDDAPAWPILVSSQDPYPGMTHLSEGQQTNSTWELYPAWPVDVTVEPPGSAEVLVARTKVQVLPHRGFTFADWQVTSGQGEAQRTGDLLDFTLTGPCAVTVRMEARTPARLSFSAAEGQSAPQIDEFLGDTVRLPAPEGTPVADAHIYHFLGWSQENPSEDTAQCPRLMKPGTAWTLTQPETVLYAVYGYFAPEDGVSQGQFRLVTEAPESWEGDYVITYKSTKALRANKAITGLGILSPLAVATDTVVGYYVDGDWLNEVPEEIVYSYVPTNDGSGLLRMKTWENYLAVPSSNTLLSTVTDPAGEGTRWRMAIADGTVRITNARFPSRILQYSPTSSGFCTLTTLRGPLTLYARVPGEHLYTTHPAMKSDPQFRFDDVQDPDKYYYTPVYWAYYHHPQITAGTSATTFGPGAPCTRAQVMTFLWRAAGSPEPVSDANPFMDVKSGAYYEKAVLWAVENHITSGLSPQTFGPKEPCTRAQIVTFLWRAAGSPEPVSDTNPFADVKSGVSYEKAVLWAWENRITSGQSAARFGPKTICTRAQIVTFLYRYKEF